MFGLGFHGLRAVLTGVGNYGLIIGSSTVMCMQVGVFLWLSMVHRSCVLRLTGYVWIKRKQYEKKWTRKDNTMTISYIINYKPGRRPI
jgi:hypothetical protein